MGFVLERSRKMKANVFGTALVLAAALLGCQVSYVVPSGGTTPSASSSTATSASPSATPTGNGSANPSPATSSSPKASATPTTQPTATPVAATLEISAVRPGTRRVLIWGAQDVLLQEYDFIANNGDARTNKIPLRGSSQLISELFSEISLWKNGIKVGHTTNISVSMTIIPLDDGYLNIRNTRRLQLKGKVKSRPPNINEDLRIWIPEGEIDAVDVNTFEQINQVPSSNVEDQSLFFSEN